MSAESNSIPPAERYYCTPRSPLKVVNLGETLFCGQDARMSMRLSCISLRPHVLAHVSTVLI